MKDVAGRRKCCTSSFVYLLSFLCEDVSVPWFFWNVEGHRLWIESIELQNYRIAEVGKSFKAIQSNHQAAPPRSPLSPVLKCHIHLGFEDSSFLKLEKCLHLEVFVLLFHCPKDIQAAFMEKQSFFPSHYISL